MTKILTTDLVTEIVEATRQTLGTAIEQPKLYRLGNPRTGKVDVPQPEIPGMVWINPIGDLVGDPLPAVSDLSPAQMIYGAFVEVVRWRGYYRVIRPSPENGLYTGGTGPGETNDGFLVSASQIDIALIRPTDPPSLAVIISEAYRLYEGRLYRQNTKDAILIGYVPSSGAVVVFIELDILTNQLKYTTETLASPDLSLKDNFNNLPREVTDGRAPIGYVKLVAGQTSIKRSDILVVNGFINSGEVDPETKAYISGVDGLPYRWLDGTMVLKG